MAWKTFPGNNTWEERQKRNKKTEAAQKFGESVKKQKQHSEWEKGTHGMAEKKD